MIVDESDALLVALDRRLRVDGVLALAQDTPNPDATRGSRSAPFVTTGAGAARGATTVASFQADGLASLAQSLPLGRVVTARVIDVLDANHVVADVEQWRLTLTMPDGASSARPGDDIALRVLAHEPVLLLQNLDARDTSVDRAVTDVAMHWSRDAMELARRTVVDDGHGTQTFTKPILELASAAVLEATRSDPTVDVVASPVRDPSTTMPTSAGAIVLQGPAWAGQPMEIVVHRERADEAFDNAALDQWCGEIVIDLPMLGRVTGHLAWSIQGLRIRLEGADDESAASMTAATPELAAALVDAALPVIALSVGRPTIDGTSTRRG